MEKHTSLKLSKLFKEVGFEKPTSFFYADVGKGKYHLTDELTYGSMDSNGKGEIKTKDFYAYDIIYDLCILYAKEVWGEETGYIDNLEGERYKLGSAIVLWKIQNGESRETIENYIIKNSPLFNK